MYTSLISKGPRPLLPKIHSKLPFLLQRVKKFENYFVCTFNGRILHLTSKRICGINFKIFDCLDCKISSFKTNKTSFLQVVGLDYLTLNLFNLNWIESLGKIIRKNN